MDAHEFDRQVYRIYGRRGTLYRAITGNKSPPWSSFASVCSFLHPSATSQSMQFANHLRHQRNWPTNRFTHHAVQKQFNHKMSSSNSPRIPQSTALPNWPLFSGAFHRSIYRSVDLSIQLIDRPGAAASSPSLIRCHTSSFSLSVVHQFPYEEQMQQRLLTYYGASVTMYIWA